MPIVTWSDEYNVNVEEIDLQHRRLLELVNNLHASVEARKEKDDLKAMLVELVEFTAEHFATEERLMQEHDYPEYKRHRKEHKTLLKHMNELVHMVSRGKSPTFYSDYDVSTDWALLHIAEQDKQMGEFLNGRGVF